MPPEVASRRSRWPGRGARWSGDTGARELLRPCPRSRRPVSPRVGPWRLQSPGPGLAGVRALRVSGLRPAPGFAEGRVLGVGGTRGGCVPRGRSVPLGERGCSVRTLNLPGWFVLWAPGALNYVIDAVVCLLGRPPPPVAACAPQAGPCVPWRVQRLGASAGFLTSLRPRLTCVRTPRSASCACSLLPERP